MVMNPYENTQLIAMVNKQRLPSDFWLDYGFPAANTVMTSADKVAIVDYTESTPFMAPYVDPCGPGCALKRPETAGQILEFAPPAVKLKEVLRPCDAEKMRVDPKTGQFVQTYANRMEAAVADNVSKMRNSVIELLRFTAAQLLHNGAYTIEGSKIKTALMDFMRDEKLSGDLTAEGSEMKPWNESAADPDALLEYITETMLCYGIQGTIDVIYSPKAWAHRKMHIEMDRRDFNYPSSSDTVLDTSLVGFAYAQYKGQSGIFRHWLVNQKYKDPADGVMKDMIPDGSILVVQRESYRGMRVYGGIHMADGSTVMQPMYFRDHIDMECDNVRTLHLESRPMLIPGNVNASACFQVVDPSLPVEPLCPPCVAGTATGGEEVKRETLTVKATDKK